MMRMICMPNQNVNDMHGQHAIYATILTCHHHDQCGISKTSVYIRLYTRMTNTSVYVYTWINICLNRQSYQKCTNPRGANVLAHVSHTEVRTLPLTFPIQSGVCISNNNQQMHANSITIPSIIIHQSNHLIELYIHTLKRACF